MRDDSIDAIATADRQGINTGETAVTLVQAALHKGEAEAIVLATELHAERLVMDDQDARRFANRCGLTVIGPLGILLAAEQRGANRLYQDLEYILPHDQSPSGGGAYAKRRGGHSACREFTGHDRID